MYFKEFPQFLYDFRHGPTTTKTSVVVDITRNVRFRKEVLENIAVYDEYDIVDGETPEIIAEKVYGNPEYHWIVMLANGYYDNLTDFPKTDLECVEAAKIIFNPELTGSWSYSGTTITVTSALHGIQVSPTTTVTIKGATATTNTPNGTYTVTAVPDENTFRFSVTSAPTGTSGGTLTIKTLGKENYIRHYVNADGFVVNSNANGAVPVTNLTFFQSENDSKRRIKIISPNIVNKILTDYKDLL